MATTKKKSTKKTKAHPGFDKASHQIAEKQGISEERADKILAAGARKASASAKAKNPKLKKVKGA